MYTPSASVTVAQVLLDSFFIVCRVLRKSRRLRGPTARTRACLLVTPPCSTRLASTRILGPEEPSGSTTFPVRV